MQYIKSDVYASNRIFNAYLYNSYRQKKEAFNFVISTNISIFIVLKNKYSIRDKQITMFRMYKVLCGGW